MERSTQTNLNELCINTIRTLSMDAVQAAKSGHPGTPMAMAPVAYCLWQHFLRFDPQDPIWPNRDRFVLSIGHASMLLYSLLHLTGTKAVSKDYETLGELSVPLQAIKNFRQLGSKNVGATNVGRVLGRRLGFICFVLDVSKGAVPVLVAGLLNDLLSQPITSISPSQMWLWLAVPSASVLGHMYSMFLGLRGGKGVATAFGGMLAMWPLLTFPALGVMIIWYGVLRLTRYVSIASMTASLSLPLAYLVRILPPDAMDVELSQTLDRVWRASPPLIITTALALLIVFQHRSNIARLRRGDEPKSDDP